MLTSSVMTTEPDTRSDLTYLSTDDSMDSSTDDSMDSSTDDTQDVPSSMSQWNLYDSNEAQQYSEKGTMWLQERIDRLERKYIISMDECGSWVRQARHMVRDLRLEYAAAERDRVVGDRLFAALCKTSLPDDLGEAWQDLRVRTSDVKRRVVVMLQSRLLLCDDIKERMYVLQQAIGLVSDVTHAPACGICMTNPVNLVCVPCGHTICSSCSLKMLDMKCFVCRSVVEHLNKVIL